MVRLTRDYQGKGHYLYVNDFYCTETVNSNCAGYPPELADEAKGINKGEFRWRKFNELVVTVWQDIKDANLFSVVHPARETVKVTRNRRQREGARTVHRQIQTK